jgi:primosomal protein N' (replication factor Y)
VLASIHNAKVLLGTATPSIETYYNAQTDKYGFVYLGTRFGGVSMPEVKIVDTLVARKKKLMKSIFSPELITAIDATLKKGEQVILFQNRRGYSPFVECDECAWVPQCKHCAVTLTYHKRGNVLACHYCGYTMDSPSSCLACGSARLSNKGFGTEKVEDELGVFFPNARVERMDLDTTRARSSYERIISEFEEGRIDILVGTQMVTKGLDFGRVSLVGILNADNMLNFPDFRAHERSFHLMTQVSGRAGRRDERGLVIIQTANPNHEIVKQVISSDFTGFFRNQLAERQQYSYPPYFRIIKISVRHRKPELLALAAAELGKHLRAKLKNRVLGPEEPLINRIQDFFIMELIVKLERTILLPRAKQVIIEEITKVKEYKPFASVVTSIDVDPL